MSDAVLPSIDEKYDSSSRSASKRYCSSSTCPRHSSPIVVSEEPGHVGAERGREGRGPRKQVVAGEDGDDVRPAGVDAGDAAAGLGLVDHVVVVQRAHVDQLDRSGAGDGLVGSGPGSERRIGGTEGQGRPEPLASGRDQMTGHLAEEAVLGVDLVGQTGLDPGQVARQGFEADILEEAHARPLSALVDGSTPGSAPLRSLRPASPWAGPLGPRLRCSLMPQSYRRDRT